jgi:hypothetical protein
MSLENGILNLASWLGNVIMPTMAGLLFAVAIVRYAKGYPWSYSMWAAVAALCVSGLVRGLESLSSQAGWNDPDLIWITLRTIVDWVGNVFLPLFAVSQVVLGVIHYAGVGRLLPGTAWVRHFSAAGLCLLASGILRLTEFFVLQGTAGVS